jgi:muconate cycloisomerase
LINRTKMKILSAKLFAIRIPFKHPFSHGLAVRRGTESVVVQLTADTGETGFGEGAPRAYVTGETTASCLAQIENVFLPAVFRHEFRDFSEYPAPAALPAEIHDLLPAEGNGEVIAFHAAKCAVELALLDVVLKHAGRPFGILLPPCGKSLIYSAVISADDVKTARAITTECVRSGMKYFKVKVGQGDDYERVAAVREIAGDAASLRVDANGAFSETEALALLRKLCPLRIESMEQPVKRGDVRSLARVKNNSPIPVMVDESLVTERDAMELIEHGACGIFNLRISKNGGVYQTLRLAGIAHKAGLEVQIGCQAGETALLSAAGRHLAAHIHDVKFLEGSYGRLLLEADISREPMEFGLSGFAPLLKGAGLGIDVLEESLKKYAVKTIEVSRKQI